MQRATPIIDIEERIIRWDSKIETRAYKVRVDDYPWSIVKEQRHTLSEDILSGEHRFFIKYRKDNGRWSENTFAFTFYLDYPDQNEDE